MLTGRCTVAYIMSCGNYYRLCVFTHVCMCVCVCVRVLCARAPMPPQVLEMNASSQRSRSQVMSHLMEASLSHQVKTSNTISTFFSPSTKPRDHSAGNKSKSVGRGIASFFKPVGPKCSANKEKPGGGDDVAEKSQKKVIPAKPGCANVHLAKTGLILLEDVSVCMYICVFIGSRWNNQYLCGA